MVSKGDLSNILVAYLVARGRNKMSKLKQIFFSVSVILMVFSANAQRLSDSPEVKKINDVLGSYMNADILPDSTAIYAFTFRLEIISKNAKTFVKEIVPNDSVANKIFPRYKELENADVSSMGFKRNRHYYLIIPVYVGIIGTKSEVISRASFVFRTSQIIKNLLFSEELFSKITHTNPLKRKLEIIYSKPLGVIYDKNTYE